MRSSLSLSLFVVGMDRNHPPKTPKRSRTLTYKKTWVIAAPLQGVQEKAWELPRIIQLPKQAYIHISIFHIIIIVNFTVKTNHLAWGLRNAQPYDIDIPGPRLNISFPNEFPLMSLQLSFSDWTTWSLRNCLRGVASKKLTEVKME